MAALAEHGDYVDRLICAGAAGQSGREPFIAKIKAKIDMGEASRQRQLSAERDRIHEQADAKAEVINQTAMEKTLGKSSGKGSSGKVFSARSSTPRYTPLAGKSEWGEDAIKNILKATDSKVVQVAQGPSRVCHIDDASHIFGPRPAPTSPAGSARGSSFALPTQWLSLRHRQE